MLDGAFGRQSTTHTVKDATATFDSELLGNLQAAGIGALSSYLTAELVNALGIGGFAGALANTAAGTAMSQIITNVADMIGGSTTTNVFTDVNPTMIATAVGSFIGTTLASKLVSFDTVGGQIGSAVGAGLGAIAAVELLKLGAVLGGPLGAAVGAAIGAFVGFIAGGLIGSVFGGTPRSGADVEWDAKTGQFIVDNVWSKKGGSKQAARGMAQAAADTINAVIGLSGGKLIDPNAVEAGNYGMRKKKYVHRDANDQIDFSVGGKDGAAKAIGFGVYNALTDSDFQIMGGDVFVKRALYNTFELGGLNPADFDTNVLLGNLASAQRYETYLQNSTAINALISAESDSVFAAEWAITLARAVELGLTRRAASDWFGGFNYVLNELAANPANVGFRFEYDPFSGRISRAIDIGAYTMGDAIDVAGQDIIEGTSGNDTIVLTATQLAATNGVTNAGLTVNGAAFNGQAKDIDVAAIVDAGAGDDFVQASDRGDNVFGGAGNDVLVGGKLDDWLLGGDGNDRLFAGRVATTSFGDGDQAAINAALGVTGGNGNYLDGGAGDDRLYGATGADWLKGGDGADLVYGGAGGDILEGGKGNDQGAGGAAGLLGGSGTDQYIFNRGDGFDVIFDESDSTAAAGATFDSISKRIADIEAGALARNWAGGGEFTVDGSVKGGEDAIVFGAGIDMGSLILKRSGTDLAPGMDLIVQLVDPATGAWNGTDQLTVKDWFESTRRVEWLRFANGEEIRIGDMTSFKIGTAGNDVIVGTNGADFLYGGDGNDKIWGLDGDDFGVGGKGNDLVSGDDDNDLLLGGADDDVVLGGDGNDTSFGDDGNDRVYGDAGRDIVVGGKGNDEVIGGAGDDIFRFNRGDGQDTMFDELAGTWELVLDNSGYTNGYALQADGTVTKDGVVYYTGSDWLGRYKYNENQQGTVKEYRRWIAPGSGSIVANAGTDTLEFGVGIDVEDLIFRTNGSNLDVAIAPSGANVTSFASITDRITLLDWYSAGATIENFQFVNTGRQQVSSMTLTGGTDASDTITAGSFASWITGGAGDDGITGSASADILSGGSGTDSLKGGAGNDVLYGGTGDDSLDGGAGGDVLVGGAGIDIASYASVTGNNPVGVFLTAQLLNWGEAKDDSYVSIEGITGTIAADNLAGDDGDNVIAGGTGADNLYGGAGDDTYVWNFNDHSDVINDKPFVVDQAVNRLNQLMPGYSVTKWASTGVAVPGYTGRTYYSLEVTGPDGQLSYKYDQFNLAGSPPTQPLPNSYIQAGWLNGFSKSFNGIAFGDNQVARMRFVDQDGGEDTLEFGPDVSLSTFTFAQSGNDLLLTYNTNNVLTLKDQFLANTRIEWLQFQDGLTASLANVVLADANGQATGGTEDNLIVGRNNTTTGDVLNGGAGNDVLAGLTGNDSLNGGDGDDMLEGGAGADTLSGGANSAIGSSESAGDTARYTTSAAVNVDLRRTGAQSGGDAAGDILSGIENVSGSNTGNDTLTGDDNANRLFGLGGNDTLDGLGGDDVLVGDEGNDILYGRLGVDNLSGGEGGDTLWGGDGNDLLDGGDGVDILHGEVGDDRIIGGFGDDSLYGEAGADQLSGGLGNDGLWGGDGNDMLAGDEGDDTLRGEAGDDSYVFTASSGVDTVIDAAGANRILFSDVAYDRLWLRKTGNDLRINVIGGTTEVLVKDYFAATGQTLVREIATATHSLFPKYAGGQTYTGSLIETMTTIGPVTPATMPATVASLLGSYWWQGGKAAPLVSDQSLGMDERSEPTGAPALLQLSGSAAAVDHDENITGYALLTNAAHGTVTLNTTTGAWVYQPVTYYHGNDSFVVEVTDADGQKARSTVNVAIASINSRPTAIALVDAATGFAERDRPLPLAEMGAVVLGTIVVSDPDAPDANDFDDHAFTVSDSRFEVFHDDVANAYRLRLKAGAAFDFEDVGTAGQVSVTVTATDRNGAGLSIAQGFTFAITDVDDYREATTVGEALNGQEPRGGFGGRDILKGLAGDNVIHGLGGNDDLYGGADNDTLYGEAGTDSLNGETGHDSLYGGDGADTLRGGDGNDLLDGGTDASADTLYGGQGNDSLLGGAGDDSLVGDDGDDLLNGSTGADSYDGGLGTDTVTYANAAAAVTAKLAAADRAGEAVGDSFVSIENLIGSAFADTLVGDANANWIEGGAGGDWLQGEGGDDSLIGQDGDDSLYGMDGGDVLDGGNGADTLDGGAGNDNLKGGAGADTLFGGAGDDLIDGGTGNDVLDGGDGSDTYLVWTDSGADTINNYDPSGGDIDVLGYQGGIARENLWFERSGNDLIVTVVGTGTATRIANWYTLATASDRANYKIDFFIADTKYTKTVDAEALAVLMAGYTKPTAQAAFDTLQANSTFRTDWLQYWGDNQPPAIVSIANQVINEDGTLTLTITITDDVTPANGITVTAEAVDPANTNLEDLSTVYAPTVGAADANGNRTLTVIARPNVSGQVKIKVTAVDAGGRSRQQLFDLSVTPVADTPTLSLVSSTGNTLENPGGIAINLEATLADTDGSEVIDVITISNVPTGLSFNQGVNLGGGVWQFEAQRIGTTATFTVPGLAINQAPGWYQDLTGAAALKVKARSRETANGVTAQTAESNLAIVINARPTNITADRAVSVSEFAVNAALIANFTGTDPDGDTMTYSLVAGHDGGGVFNMRSDGVLTVANQNLLNFEATPSYAIKVRTTDALGLSYDKDFTVSVIDENEKATFSPSSYSFAAINENVAVGTNVGSVSASDVDAGTFGTKQYYFANPNGVLVTSSMDGSFNMAATTQDGLFRIDQATGQITVNGTVSWESTGVSNTYTVLVRDTTANPRVASATTVINVNDLNEAPVIAAGQSYTISEAQPGGQPISTTPVSMTDPDTQTANRNHVYSITGGAPAGMFAISSTGIISLHQAVDYDTMGANKYYDLTVRVTDQGGSGLSDTKTVRVNVTDVNERPMPIVTPWAEVIDSGLGGTWVAGGVTINPNDPDTSSGFAGPFVYTIDNVYVANQYGVYTPYNNSLFIWESAYGYYRIQQQPNVPSWKIKFDFTARDAGGLVSDRVTAVWISPYYSGPPIVLDLDGDGTELVGLVNSTVRFDMDSDGVRDRTGWAAADDGFLVLDRNGNGAIDDAHEISFIEDLPGATTDLEGLQAFDSNGNGMFDRGDARWGEFQIWQDANQDGISDAGELLGLDDRGIQSINLSATPTGQSAAGATDNVIVNTGDYLKDDGTIGELADVFLGFEASAQPIVTMTPLPPVQVSTAPPIVLDLDGDGAELVSLTGSAVQFDMDGDGDKEKTGWAAADDGFLALDRNGNGRIDDIGEISFVQDLAGATTDLEGLQAFDSNANGLFDRGDARWGAFSVWQDADQDGVSDAGELLSLDDRGIQSINLSSTATGQGAAGAADNVVVKTGEYLKDDGSIAALADVFLAYEGMVQQQGAVTIPEHQGQATDEPAPQTEDAARTLPTFVQPDEDTGAPAAEGPAQPTSRRGAGASANLPGDMPNHDRREALRDIPPLPKAGEGKGQTERPETAMADPGAEASGRPSPEEEIAPAPAAAVDRQVLNLDDPLAKAVALLAQDGNNPFAVLTGGDRLPYGPSGAGLPGMAPGRAANDQDVLVDRQLERLLTAMAQFQSGAGIGEADTALARADLLGHTPQLAASAA